MSTQTEVHYTQFVRVLYTLNPTESTIHILGSTQRVYILSFLLDLNKTKKNLNN